MHLIFLIIFSLFFTSLHSQGFLKTAGKKIVDRNNNEVILRGIGLGGWMLQEPYMLQLSGVATNQSDIKKKIQQLIGTSLTDSFYNKWLANHCKKADIDSLAAWGFNSVRLPMHYNLYTLPIELEPVAGHNTWLEKGFILTDSLLKWCKDNEIYLILDLHAAPGGQGKDAPIADYDASKPSLWESEENRKKTVALWQKLAERYANEEWLGGYDLINETNWGFTDTADKNGCAENDNSRLRELLVDITTAIRKVDTNHIIYIEGNCWANNYNGIFPLWDNNLVVSFHKYWNYNDKASIQKFLDIREKYNVPIWMGESGENSNVWFRNAIALLEENKIGWAWWPMKKLGINNPLHVKANEGYQKIISYWKSEAGKPSQQEAVNALMQLAEDVKIENNIYKKDVIDAMFRQVTSDQTLSFKENIISRNGTILFAVDYDLGRNRFAYFDNDTANYRVSTNENIIWNKGRAYRNDGADIKSCTDNITNGYCISWFEEGEWLQYTVTVEAEGKYDFHTRYAADSIGAIKITINNAKSYNSILKKSSSEWNSNYVQGISLKKGRNTIRISVNEGSVGLNYLEIKYVN
jgi:endoglucanase